MKAPVNTPETAPRQSLFQRRAGCSVLRFEDRPIPEDALDRILEAGCQTVSPWNLQPWQFIVLRAPEARQLVLRHCGESGPAPSAPALIVGIGNPRAWKRAPERLAELVEAGSLAPGTESEHLERIRRQWGVGDAARVLAIAQTHAALQQIFLAAHACELDTCWVDDFDGPGVARALHIPPDLIVVGVLCLGYCQERRDLPITTLCRCVFAEAYGLPWQRSRNGKEP